jgi:hypothetical protein
MAFDANDLSPHEHFVVERTRAGDWADFTIMGASEGGRPSVRAGFLRKLLLELDATWTVRGPGVRLRGVRIDGALDLTDCSGATLPALSFDGCEIGDAIDISRARLTRLSLDGCILRGVIGTDARVEGDVSLVNAIPAGSPGAETLRVDVRGARIGGDVRFSAAKVAGTESDRVAVRLDGAEIGGDLLFDEGFEAFGAVSLSGAHIGGALVCDGAQFMNRSDDAKGVALSARGAEIGGDVRLGKAKIEGELDLTAIRIGGDIDLAQALLRNENGATLRLANARIAGQVAGAVKIGGQVTLQGADIARNLDLRGAEISNPISGRAASFGVAIDAASLSVGGAALLQGANIKGELFLADARIAGYLGLGGGRFINGGGWAIRAPNVRVGGNLTLKVTDFAPLGQKTVIEGGAMFDRAQIDGGLTWSALELRGPGPGDDAKGGVLSIEDATVRGALHAKGLVAQAGAKIDLSGATCVALEDDPANGWGAESVWIDAEGFSYGRIENANENWRTRLGWLKRTRRAGGGFSPQPYTQAAQVYARVGRRDDARRIQLAQADQRTLKASSGPLTWALSSLFGLVAGYGLAPIRVLRALVLFIALGIGGVLAMNAQGALVTAEGRACNGAVEPALYAIDVALPIIDLGQETRCAPGRTARAELSPGVAVGDGDWRLFEGAALWKWAHALYAVLGAILAALAVITFSGVLKPKD